MLGRRAVSTLWLALCWYFRQARQFLLSKIPDHVRAHIQHVAEREKATRRWEETAHALRAVRVQRPPVVSVGDEDSEVIWEGTKPTFGVGG
jgi:hypothetical protein